MLPLRSAANCCYGETNQFCYGTNYIYLWTLQTAQLARLKIIANGTTSKRQANRQQRRRQRAANKTRDLQANASNAAHQGAAKRKSRCRQTKKHLLAKQEAIAAGKTVSNAAVKQ